MGKEFFSFSATIQGSFLFYRDECRFPHVLPDAPAPVHQAHFVPRGGHRLRPSGNVNVLEEKLSSMTLQDVSQLTSFLFSLMTVSRTG